jgi:hypothetical protein
MDFVSMTVRQESLDGTAPNEPLVAQKARRPRTEASALSRFVSKGR